MTYKTLLEHIENADRTYDEMRPVQKDKQRFGVPGIAGANRAGRNSAFSSMRGIMNPGQPKF